MSRAPAIAAIVLNWNGGGETLRCLRSLREVREPPIRLILADNGSRDGSIERALEEDPTLEVLRLGENLGYAAGNNRAMSRALEDPAVEWVCLVNSDVEVEPDVFVELMRVAEGPGPDGRPIGALGPCFVYLDDPAHVWACGGDVAATVNMTRLLDQGRTGPSRIEPASVDFLPGACLLVSREVCERVGLLDEDFFCYMEDVDWCVRIRAAGYGVVVVPRANARHGLSSSTGGGYSPGRKYMTAVNSVRFLRKHGGIAGWLALFFFDVALWPLTLVRGMLTGHTAAALAKLRGVLDGLRGARIDAAIAARYARKGIP